jgi:hypothetical protein
LLLPALCNDKQWLAYVKELLDQKAFGELQGAMLEFNESKAAAKGMKPRPTSAELAAQAALTSALMLLAFESGYDPNNPKQHRNRRGIALAAPAFVAALRVNAGQGMGALMNNTLRLTVSQAAVIDFKVGIWTHGLLGWPCSARPSTGTDCTHCAAFCCTSLRK